MNVQSIKKPIDSLDRGEFVMHILFSKILHGANKFCKY